MDILFIGPPGSGKGTQAVKLAERKKLKHLSTGDLFRKHLKEKSSLGQQVQLYIDKGELVPDRLTNDMVEVFLKELSLEEKIIFDGFPRNLFQASALDQMLKQAGRQLAHVFYFEIADDQVVDRLTGRLWAPKSGCIYHIRNKPPQKAGICDQSGEALIVRSDDKEEIVRSRLKVFHENTKPLIDYYEKKGLLNRISAETSPETVFQSLLKALEGKSG